MIWRAISRYFSDAIDAISLTQREIAQRAGLLHPNVLSMFKSGESKIPLDRIPGLAQACGVDAAEFLQVALAEYHPAIWQVLMDIFGVPLSDTEREMIAIVRDVELGGEIVMDEQAQDALWSVLALARRDE